MAEFQITETKRSLPATGTGVHGNIYTGTGEDEMWHVMGGAGTMIFNIGYQLYKLQGEAELTQRISEANEGFQKLQLDLIKEDDPEQYLQRYNDYWADIEATKVKNGYARRRWSAALPTLQRTQQRSIFNAYTSKIQDNHKWAIAHATSEYINGRGSRASVEAMLRSEQETFGTSDKEVQYHLAQADKSRKIEATRQQEKLLTDVVGTNPDEAYKVSMKAIETGKVPETFLGVPIPDLRIGHMREAKNLAIHDIQVREKRDRELNDAVSQQMNKHAWNLVSASDVMKELNANEGLTPEQRITHLDEYFDALNIRLKVDKKPDAQEFEKEAAVQNVLYKYIDGISAREVGVEIPEDTRVFVKEYALRVFEDAIKTKKLTDENEKRKEAIKIGMNIKELLADGYFENVFPEKLPLPTKPKGPLHGKLKAGQFIPPASLGKQLGLGKIWEQMNDIEKITAVSAREKNVSAKDLIDEFNRNK